MTPLDAQLKSLKATADWIWRETALLVSSADTPERRNRVEELWARLKVVKREVYKLCPE